MPLIPESERCLDGLTFVKGCVISKSIFFIISTAKIYSPRPAVKLFTPSHLGGAW